jgi:hypothetical protein
MTTHPTPAHTKNPTKLYLNLILERPRKSWLKICKNWGERERKDSGLMQMSQAVMKAKGTWQRKGRYPPIRKCSLSVLGSSRCWDFPGKNYTGGSKCKKTGRRRRPQQITGNYDWRR